MIEHKSFDVEWKGLGDDSGSVEMYAATFGNIDRTGERIEPGAFKNLQDFVDSGWIAVNHDWNQLPIASVNWTEQDGKGLKINAQFHSTPAAQAVRTTIKERIDRGKSVKASIGYKVLEDEKVDVDGKSIRSLKAIDLYEASIVNVPANTAAGVIGAKSLMTLDELAGLIAEYKAGRVLSDANRQTMMRWREQHAKIMSEIDSLLAATAPMKDPMPMVTTEPSIPKSLTSEFVDLYKESLAIRSRYSHR